MLYNANMGFFLHLRPIMVVVAFLFCSATCLAQGGPVPPWDASTGAIRPVVVIVSLERCCRGEWWPEAEEKIRQEFIQGGVEVITVHGLADSEAERRMELAAVADAYGAAAAVRIVKNESMGQPAGVDLWICDRVTHKTVYRYLPIDHVGSGESSVVAGLKTIELFRGSLQEIHLSAQPHQPLPESIQIMTRSPAHPKDKRRRFRLGAGFSGIFFSRDVGPRSAPVVMAAWMPRMGVLLQAEGWFGVMGRDIKAGNYGASMIFNCIVLKPMWEMRNVTIVRPAIGPLLGAAFVSLEGHSPNAGQEKKVNTVSPLLGISTQMGVAFSDSFGLTPFFDMGIMLSRVAVFFDDTEVARFGAPVLHAGVLLDAHF